MGSRPVDSPVVAFPVTQRTGVSVFMVEITYIDGILITHRYPVCCGQQTLQASIGCNEIIMHRKLNKGEAKWIRLYKKKSRNLKNT
ncbi:MAG: hypothetical protein K0R09_2130 [Clostridiales bacterium]|nr:hypothetical protein [Clostridiales bacterium]